MKAICYDANGHRSIEMELPASLFEAKYKPSLIYEVVRAEQANNRQGTRKTKRRSEISGRGKKPWRQKGTGNARHGSTRSPQWRGGAVAFGPQPNRRRINLPEKIRKAGIHAIFSSWGKKDKSIHILQGFDLNEYSTKKAYNVFKNMGVIPKSTVVFISDSEETFMKKSFANIRNIYLMNAKRVSPTRLFYAGNLVIAESSLAYLTETYKKSPSKTKTKTANKESNKNQGVSQVTS